MTHWPLDWTHALALWFFVSSLSGSAVAPVTFAGKGALGCIAMATGLCVALLCFCYIVGVPGPF